MRRLVLLLTLTACVPAATEHEGASYTLTEHALVITAPEAIRYADGDVFGVQLDPSGPYDITVLENGWSEWTVTEAEGPHGTVLELPLMSGGAGAVGRAYITTTRTYQAELEAP